MMELFYQQNQSGRQWNQKYIIHAQFYFTGSVPAPSLGPMILFLITYSHRHFYALMLAMLNVLNGFGYNHYLASYMAKYKCWFRP